MTYFWSALFFVAIYAYLIVRLVRAPDDSTEMGLLGLAFLGLMIVSAWASAALAFKRLHDMGYPGFWSIGVFIPVVSMIFFIALAVMPGQPGRNEYGEPPTDDGDTR